MIASLRRRFILIAMSALTLTLLCLIGGINLSYGLRADAQAAHMLDLLHRTDGRMPDSFQGYDEVQATEETPFQTRYFVVTLAADGSVARVDLSHIAAVDQEGAVDAAEQILKGGEADGYLGRYRFAVRTRDDGGQTVLVLDCYQQQQSRWQLLTITCAAAAACWVAVLFLLMLFSHVAVRPFAENLARQKRFVTDASHELKTPLAVIAANTEVLALEQGESEWLASIRGQIGRMNGLIGSMMELACAEEADDAQPFQPFALSEAVEESVVPFETLIAARGAALETAIEPGLTLHGAEDSMRRLVSILLDNAAKYTDPGGVIRLRLARAGRSGVQLAVSNTCAAFDARSLPYLFDRFYRADDSRTRATGGSGVGLSIAAGIAQRHRGRLTAHYRAPELTIALTIGGGALTQGGKRH